MYTLNIKFTNCILISIQQSAIRTVSKVRGRDSAVAVEAAEVAATVGVAVGAVVVAAVEAVVPVVAAVEAVVVATVEDGASFTVKSAAIL